MKADRTLTRIWISPLAGLALALSGCGEQLPANLAPTSPETAATGCQSGQAQIAVLDGLLRNLCGCAEPGGQIVASGAGTLNCTVPVGTTVFFLYVANTRAHEIVATGTPAFAPSPVSDPTKEVRVQVHAVQLTQAGTYAFEDVFESGMKGQLIAQ